MMGTMSVDSNGVGGKWFASEARKVRESGSMGTASGQIGACPSRRPVATPEPQGRTRIDAADSLGPEVP